MIASAHDVRDGGWFEVAARQGVLEDLDVGRGNEAVEAQLADRHHLHGHSRELKPKD
jgi:hypothetical protein